MTRAKDISKILTDANISGTLDVTGETTLATHLNLGDNDTIKLGASADFSIFHDGSNSHIVDSGTGNLNISATNFNVYNAGGTEQKIGATTDGAVDLYHNGSKKFETSSTGVTVTGGVTGTSATLTGDITASSFNGGQLGGRRNVVINGAMQLAQRGTSSTGLGANGDTYLLDRFRLSSAGSTAGRFTLTQTADGPNGFANCLKVACTTADTSIGASENQVLVTAIEGQDLQQFKKGTSDAETFTVSFYVKGHDSATYTFELFDGDNSRQVSQTFSVTTDWTRVILTFPADTTGAFGDDNGASLYLQIHLHAGSNFTSGTLNTSWASSTTANRVSSSANSIFESTSATFSFTGLQLEVGSQATPFEHRSFGEELALCQRYFYKYEGSVVEWIYCEGNGASLKFWAFQIPVSMRAVPSFSHGFSHGTSNGIQINTIALTGSSDSRILLRVTYASSSGASNTMHHTDGWNGEYAFLSSEI